MKIRLLWKWLRYDVQQLTWRYARARMEDKQPEVGDLASEDDSKTSDNLVYRLCLTGLARLGVVLRKYIDENGDEADDDGTRKAPSWVFTLREGSDMAGAQSMAGLMHWFVVRFAVWSWLKMYSPAEAAGERQELKDLEDEMTSALDLGVMPMKGVAEEAASYDDIEYMPIEYEMRDKALAAGD